MLFVSHDRAFLRGLSNRVLELGGETGTETQPHAYPGFVRRIRRAHRPRSAGRALLIGPQRSQDADADHSYSARSATVGGRRAARRAGSQLARMLTSAISESPIA